MKKIIFFALAAAIMCMGLNACQKDTADTTPSNLGLAQNLENGVQGEIVTPVGDALEENGVYLLKCFPHARFFALEKNNPNAAAMLALYQSAAVKGEMLYAQFEAPEQADYYLLKNLRLANAFETGEWSKQYPLFDSTKVQDRAYTYYLPSYQKAVDIFKYMRNQSCSSTSGLCIPFQYVADGCYARAHYMKKLMEEKFGYTCLKLFNFAKPYSSLAANASSLGCCVRWSFHVAPCVAVPVNGVYVYYVIDPSMFSTPVSAEQWLAAQQSYGCGAVGTAYNFLRPGDVYNFGSNGAALTDPYYLDTYRVMKNYQYKRGCN